MNMLLKINNDKEIIKVQGMSQEKVAEWEDGKGSGPSLKNMQPSWTNIKGQWNSTLANMFASWCHSNVEPLKSVRRQLISSLFLEHLIHLRDEHMKRMAREGKDVEAREKIVKENDTRKKDIQRPITRRVKVSSLIHLANYDFD